MGKNKDKIETLIAHSIKNADKSYFFKNYTKQAQAVIRSLASRSARIFTFCSDARYF